MKKLLSCIGVLFPIILFSQTTLTGTVSDANGISLPGVNISVQNTTRGTQTDFDGKYTIQVDQGETLVFSYVGFQLQEVSYNGQNTLNILLQEDASELATVVLTGYSKQSVRDIVSSVAVIKADDFIATAPLSVEQALQGQAAGVTVNAEGGPGGATAVRIRGFGSVNSNDPLYVIDGSQSSAQLNDINPADIESIQILKDAAAASIFGVRSANGVVVIETKKGRRNQESKLSVDAFTGFDFIPKNVFPELANPQQLADALWQASVNTIGNTPTHPQFGSGASPSLPNFITPSNTDSVDPASYSETNRITRANKEGTDWFNEFYDTGIIHNANLGLSGGSNTANYYWGIGMLDQEGVALASNFARYNTRINTEFEIGNRFRIGENFNFSYSERVELPNNQNEEGPIGQIYRIHPLIPVRDIAGNFAGTRSQGLGNGKNPVAIATRNQDNKDRRFRAIGNVFAELDIIEGLYARTNLSLEYNTGQFTNFSPPSPEDEAAVLNNSLSEATFENSRRIWTNTLNFDRVFGEHNITALAGTEFQEFISRNFSASRTDFLFNGPSNFRFLNLGRDGFANTGAGGAFSLYSLFGKVDYKYKDRYLFSATLRRDASSLFTQDNRLGVFPAFSAGWRISEESFLENSALFSEWKLKASYGIQGNDQIPARTSNLFGISIDFDGFPITNGDVTPGFSLSARGNPNLTWETTETINIGTDMLLLDKITLGFEWYRAITEDMLVEVPIDPTFAGNNNGQFQNVGRMRNTGFDLNLGYNNTWENGFTFDVALNLSRYSNEVVELNPTNPDAFIQGNAAINQNIFNRTQVGQPLASFYGLAFEGIDDNGRAVFRDIDGNGEFNSDGDRTFIGNPHPDFTYGLNVNAAYKNFDLAILIQGSQGNDIYNFTRYFTETPVFNGQKTLDYINAWTPTNRGSLIPALSNDPDIVGRESSVSSRFVEDGSYLRLKNIQLGFTVPQGFSKQFGMDKLRIYLQGKNLLTLTDYSGLDPEIGLQSFTDITANLNLGVDRGGYPISRTILFGVSASF